MPPLSPPQQQQHLCVSPVAPPFLPPSLSGVLRALRQRAHGGPRHGGRAPRGAELLRPVGVVLRVRVLRSPPGGTLIRDSRIVCCHYVHEMEMPLLRWFSAKNSQNMGIDGLSLRGLDMMTDLRVFVPPGAV